MPRLKQVKNPLPKRILNFKIFNTARWIDATKREERIAAPGRPDFEAAHRNTSRESVLPAPPPNRQERAEQLGSLRGD